MHSQAFLLAALGGFASSAHIAARATTNTNLQTAFPASSGTTNLAAARTLAAGESLDGGMKHEQAEGGDSDAVFVLQEGAVLSNVVIGPNNGEGVHCLGTCTLNNVWWTDVCEDAATFKQSSGTSYVNGGGARKADDKVLQHNGGGTVAVKNFWAQDVGKVYRSCGNCETQHARKSTFDNIKMSGGSVVAGVNGNLGDTTSIKNSCVLDGASHLRNLASSARLKLDEKTQYDYSSPNARPAIELDHHVTKEEQEDYDEKIAREVKERQIRSPWNREGSDVPPVARQRSAGAMTKGKLLTTPSRMLKLILPLTTKDKNSDRKDVEPLALLVHPQQPLSYLERLIQAELPRLKDKNGNEHIPNVYFRAEDSMQDSIQPSEGEKTPVSEASETLDEQEGEEDFEKVDEIRIEGKTEMTGKLNSATDRKTPDEAAKLRRGEGQGGVESYSGLGHEAPATKEEERKFVRWSSSTEIGDFIRDAARGQEFAVEIEGAPEHVRVGVPSFNDRTYYLRMRLRKLSKKISGMAEMKKECDHLAHKSAQRVAQAGFAGIIGWWLVVYYLTFQTELGWDVMEPVTYLVGLSTLIGGYMWFLYHNREVSYRSAMNFTVSRRQHKLYTQRGFDLRKWETLIEEGNALRKEIKAVADEYDVEWDELKEEKDEKVTEALRDERKKQKSKGKDEDDDKGDKPKADDDH
ncbi:hypothetical protein SLS60_011745 [Paraconiothyrium brasiliense]|uniref:Probable pectate lyase F n=1 Tax=Paraconiothyrium brasiliense TaxID=300254 RepID=A0ABR3QHW8_9PLEO